VAPVLIEDLAQPDTSGAFLGGDVVCRECHTVIATLYRPAEMPKWDGDVGDGQERVYDFGGVGGVVVHLCTELAEGETLSDRASVGGRVLDEAAHSFDTVRRASLIIENPCSYHANRPWDDARTRVVLETDYGTLIAEGSDPKIAAQRAATQLSLAARREQTCDHVSPQFKREHDEGRCWWEAQRKKASG
jgi:hypothetical protein